MNKILVVCGPTATGKTSLAIELASKFNGEIISADSRQIYQRMDIGTGKDIPERSKFIRSNIIVSGQTIGFYVIDGIKIWGYDLVPPEKNCSVSLYVKTAKKIINHVAKKGKLPIVVGGTGFYIKALFGEFSTLHVPKNDKLRKSLVGLSANDIFEHLSQIDSIKAASLNISDRSNPRRLMRAIEIAQWNLNNKKIMPENNNLRDCKVLYIGLRSDKNILDKKIVERVYKRVGEGFDKEATSLLTSSKKIWNKQSMDSLGYRQWKEYLKGERTKEEAISEWIRQEKRYVKRQLTWFSKSADIVWFDINSLSYEKDIVKAVTKWHNK